MRNAFDWEAARLSLRVGDRVPLVVRRGSREITVTVTVADRPEVSAPKVTVLREIELTTLTAALRAERGIQSAEGAYVTRVSEMVRDNIGLTEGDVILRINNFTIRTAQDVAQAMDQASPRAANRIVFERRGARYYSDFYIR